jgi:ABC-type phosphate transport system substrate-binding protein
MQEDKMIKKRLLYLLVLMGINVLGAYADVQIIVHPRSSLGSVSSQELEDLYLGRKKKLSDGVNAEPVDLGISALQEAFLKNYVKRSESQYRTHWKKAVFTGQGKPPKKFDTEAELIAYVAATPGALGYVSLEADVSSVKVLSVN